MFSLRGIFFDNPVAKMDQRIQMRGNRPMVVWVLYLGLLTLIASFSYWAATFSSGKGAVAVQDSLRGFNWSVMVTLSALVLLTAPALTASAMAIERQRRSLELVFSTPASPTLYAWGKLISAYRTVWVLLILAVPIAATGYVMGGGTWLDVLASFMIVSYNGLLLCAAAMAAASIASNPLGAIVLAYILGGIVQLGLTIFSAASMSSLFYGGGVSNVSPVAAMNAFFAVGFAPARTDILGTSVPTFIPAGAIVFLASLVTVMGASSGMTRYGSPETKVFRGVLLAVSALVGVVFAFDNNMASSGYAVVLYVLVAVFGLMIPIYSCCEKHGDQKFRDDGLFNVRKMLFGCPSSALPFTLALVGLTTLPAAIRFSVDDFMKGTSLAFAPFGGSFGAGTSGSNITAHALPTVYLFIFLTFLWIASRLISRFGATLGASRVLGVVAFLAIAIGPSIVLGYIQTLTGATSPDLFRVAPLSTLLPDPSGPYEPYFAHIAIGTVVVAALVTLEVKMRKSAVATVPAK